jgi:hypothetical protein
VRGGQGFDSLRTTFKGPTRTPAIEERLEHVRELRPKNPVIHLDGFQDLIAITDYFVIASGGSSVLNTGSRGTTRGAGRHRRTSPYVGQTEAWPLVDP